MSGPMSRCTRMKSDSRSARMRRRKVARLYAKDNSPLPVVEELPRHCRLYLQSGLRRSRGAHRCCVGERAGTGRPTHPYQPSASLTSSPPMYIRYRCGSFSSANCSWMRRGDFDHVGPHQVGDFVLHPVEAFGHSDFEFRTCALVAAEYASGDGRARAR